MLRGATPGSPARPGDHPQGMRHKKAQYHAVQASDDAGVDDDFITHCRMCPLVEPFPARSAVGVFSRLFFSWAQPLIDAGNTCDSLHPDELTAPLPHSMRAGEQYNRFSRAWAEEQRGHASAGRRVPSVARALHACIGREFWVAGLFRALAEIASLSTPVVLQRLIENAEDEDGDAGLGCLLGVALTGLQVANCVALQQFIYSVFLAGGNATTAVVRQCFEKLVRAVFAVTLGQFALCLMPANARPICTLVRFADGGGIPKVTAAAAWAWGQRHKPVHQGRGLAAQLHRVCA